MNNQNEKRVTRQENWIYSRNIGQIEIGAIDARGRSVGFTLGKAEWDAVEYMGKYEAFVNQAGELSQEYFSASDEEIHQCLRLTVPGHYVRLTAISSRNGKPYGSAEINAEGMDVEAVRVELNAKIARATKIALKKWAATTDAARRKEVS